MSVVPARLIPNERKTMNKIATHLDTFSICEMCDEETWHITVTHRNLATDKITYEIECENCLLGDL